MSNKKKTFISITISIFPYSDITKFKSTRNIIKLCKKKKNHMKNKPVLVSYTYYQVFVMVFTGTVFHPVSPPPFPCVFACGLGGTAAAVTHLCHYHKLWSSPPFSQIVLSSIVSCVFCFFCGYCLTRVQISTISLLNNHLKCLHLLGLETKWEHSMTQPVHLPALLLNNYSSCICSWVCQHPQHNRVSSNICLFAVTWSRWCRKVRWGQEVKNGSWESLGMEESVYAKSLRPSTHVCMCVLVLSTHVKSVSHQWTCDFWNFWNVDSGLHPAFYILRFFLLNVSQQIPKIECWCMLINPEQETTVQLQAESVLSCSLTSCPSSRDSATTTHCSVHTACPAGSSTLHAAPSCPKT